jgi:hypothetical protein
MEAADSSPLGERTLPAHRFRKRSAALRGRVLHFLGNRPTPSCVHAIAVPLLGDHAKALAAIPMPSLFFASVLMETAAEVRTGICFVAVAEPRLLAC